MNKRLQLAILTILLSCAAYSFAGTLKCIDPKGNVIYSNTSCTDNTNLKKSINGAPTITNCQIGSYIFVDNFGNKTCKNIPTSSLPTNPQYFPSLTTSLNPTDAGAEARLKEMQRQLEQLELENEIAQEAADEAREEAEDSAEQARKEAEDRAEQARQEAEDRAFQLEKAEKIKRASSRNLTYALLSLFVFGLAFYKVVKDKKQSQEDKLKANEKAGVCIALVGIMIAIASLVISGPWFATYDIWQNIIGGYPLEGVSFSLGFGLIYAKHVLLACVALIFYGITIYLKIFKAHPALLAMFEDV